MAINNTSIMKKPYGILDMAVSFIHKYHSRTLSRQILDIHKCRTLEELVNNTAHALKDILNYKLFAFAILDETGLDIWSDPILSRQRILDMMAHDFPGSEINSLTYLDQDDDRVIRTFFHKPFPLFSTPIYMENTKSCLYLVHDNPIFFKGNKSAETIIEAFKNSLDTILRIQLLEKASSTDSLTGCYNRRALMELLDRSMDSARRHGRQLSVIMFDVDHFKKINDCYGHLFGDKVLKAIAGSVSELIRKEDYMARYGGEEFLVVLPETSLNTAVEIANRLKKNIESLSLVTPCNTSLSVTASYGVSTMTAEDDINTLISEADTHLYLAKTNGRNRVVSFGI